MVSINRTKHLAHKVRSPQALKAHAAKMRNAIADRHGTKRPAVGGVTQRARIKAHKRGSQGKNNRKANTGSDVSSDDDSDTETVYSYSLQPGNGDVGLVPGEDTSVSSSKMSDYPSSLDVDGDNDTSLYGEDVSTPKLSDHEKSLDLDADTDPSLYGRYSSGVPSL
jgi:hypothetical protein